MAAAQQLLEIGELLSEKRFWARTGRALPPLIRKRF